MSGAFLSTAFLPAGFLTGQGGAPAIDIRGGVHRQRRKHARADPYALAREYNRARAAADAALEHDIVAPAQVQQAATETKHAKAAKAASLVTAALARAAADGQLTTVVRIAAAVQDRARAAEELRRRRLTLVLLLALD